MMAILIEPGSVVLAIDKAPDTRVPHLTEGVASLEESYNMVISMPATPVISSP
jgi:hypothetical protein